MIKNTNNSPSLFSNLSDMLNQSRPLYQLANKIDLRNIDSTVQEKNITYPTDTKLHKKFVKKVLGLVKKLGLPLHQRRSYHRGFIGTGRTVNWEKD